MAMLNNQMVHVYRYVKMIVSQKDRFLYSFKWLHIFGNGEILKKPIFFENRLATFKFEHLPTGGHRFDTGHLSDGHFSGPVPRNRHVGVRSFPRNALLTMRAHAKERGVDHGVDLNELKASFHGFSMGFFYSICRGLRWSQHV